MPSALNRPGTNDQLTAAEANEKGRAAGRRAEFPQRTEKWDFMTGDQINKLDGSDKAPKTPILSGEDAKQYLDNVEKAHPDSNPEDPGLRCNCAVRRRQKDGKPKLPKVYDNGICSACGVLR